MKLSEVTTGHDATKEKEFARTLFLALIIAVIIVAVFSFMIGTKKALSPFDLGPRTEQSTKSFAPSR